MNSLQWLITVDATCSFCGELSPSRGLQILRGEWGKGKQSAWRDGTPEATTQTESAKESLGVLGPKPKHPTSLET